MNFLKPKPQEHQQPSLHLNLQQAFTNLQNHFFSLKPHLDSAFINLQNQAKQALQSKFPPNSAKTLNQEPEISKTHKFSSNTAQTQNQESGFLKHSKAANTLNQEPGFSKPPSSPSNSAENPNQEPGFSRPAKFPLNSVRSPAWAQISANKNAPSLSIEEIEERLAGVPVYALSNPSEEFVLVSNVDSGKSIGFFCFKEEDAETLLAQMKSMDPGMRHGSKVVAVALNKVFQLRMDGVGFRLIPESTQIKNALNERRRAGLPDESFSGVPVFQSRSLILRSQNMRYRPVFFRKEDLDKSLSRASYDQKRMNPVLREGDIQVAVLEDILLGMKDNSKSDWDDVVFIPPGFDVSNDPSKP